MERKITIVDLYSPLVWCFLFAMYIIGRNTIPVWLAVLILTPSFVLAYPNLRRFVLWLARRQPKAE